MPTKTEDINEEKLVEMRQAGVHFGYKKARRHPSTGKFIYGIKDGVEIFDLKKSVEALQKAVDFVKKLKADEKTLLFVGTKNEARRIVKDSAISLEAPYVTNRWIGGTLTNWPEVKKRILKLKEMKEKREKGDYADKYTKKEQLLIDRDIELLEKKFGGIVGMENIPDAMFVVDPGFEEIAVNEAEQLGVPVIAIANNDCDITNVSYPIPANDSAIKSIEYIVGEITKAYK